MYLLTFSLAVALLDSLFEQPADACEGPSCRSHSGWHGAKLSTRLHRSHQ